jgi:hypothetical protein
MNLAYFAVLGTSICDILASLVRVHWDVQRGHGKFVEDKLTTKTLSNLLDSFWTEGAFRICYRSDA